jgi:hypothetical protein
METMLVYDAVFATIRFQVFVGMLMSLLAALHGEQESIEMAGSVVADA